MPIKNAPRGVFFVKWIAALRHAMTRDVASICLSCNAHKRELAFLYCHRVGVQQPMATTFCHRVGAQHQWRLPLVIASHRRWRGDPVIYNRVAHTRGHNLLDCFAPLAMTKRM